MTILTVGEREVLSNRIDLKACLSVFNHVISHGDRSDESYVFQEFTAWSDFDGYTCFLKYRDVTLTMMFHGKYDLDYPNRDELVLFEKQISQFTLRNR